MTTPEMAEHPPLFASLLSAAGETSELLCDPMQMQGNAPASGRWHCHVVAPGGVEVNGFLSLASDEPATLYRKLASLFPGAGSRQLWFDAPLQGGGRPVELERKGPLELCVWSGVDHQLSSEDWTISASASLPRVFSVETSGVDHQQEELFVETRTGVGPSIFARVRTDDLLVYGSVRIGGENRLAPKAMSRPGYHAAYWGFMRHGQVEAALLVVQRLVTVVCRERSIGEGVSAGFDETIAAAHGVTRFRKFWSRHGEIRSQLAKHHSASLDARLMQWVLTFEDRPDDNLFTSDLPQLLQAIRKSPPVFVETFRLFHERLSTAFSQARHLLPDTSALRADVEFANCLAASTYWDSDQLVYRGRTPAEPERSVVAAPRAETDASKKKSLTDAIERAFEGSSTGARQPLSGGPASQDYPTVQAVAASIASVEITEAVTKTGTAPQVASAPPRATGMQQPITRGRAPPNSFSGQVSALSDGSAKIVEAAPKPRAAPRGADSQHRASESASELSERLLDIRRVAKVVKGGRRFGFSALVVVGDGKGRAGYGHGKAREVPEAIRKATEAAKRNVVRARLKEGRSLHYDVEAKAGAALVLIRAAEPGTGIIAGGATRAVLEMFGVKDAVAKSLGKGNVFNTVRATFQALQAAEAPRDVASRRGLKVAVLRGRQAGNIEPSEPLGRAPSYAYGNAHVRFGGVSADQIMGTLQR